MRRVKFKSLNPRHWVDADGNKFDKQNAENNLTMKQAAYDADFVREGLFHCWGSDFEEGENTVASVTMAIIETPNGQVEVVYPNRVKFLDAG